MTSKSTVKLTNFDNSLSAKSLASKISFEASDWPLPLINLFIWLICLRDRLTLSTWVSISLIAPFLKFFSDLSYVLKELARAFPLSIATVLAAKSSGLLDMSCKELKNLPIKVPKSLSSGNNIFSKLFKFFTKLSSLL